MSLVDGPVQPRHTTVQHEAAHQRRADLCIRQHVFVDNHTGEHKASVQALALDLDFANLLRQRVPALVHLIPVPLVRKLLLMLLHPKALDLGANHAFPD